MEKISKDEIDKTYLKYGLSLQIKKICDMISSVEVGEGVKLGPSEWIGSNMPQSAMINRYFDLSGSPIRCKLRSISSHKGFIFIRTS